jgi:hypothetical protein
MNSEAPPKHPLQKTSVKSKDKELKSSTFYQAALLGIF